MKNKIKILYLILLAGFLLISCYESNSNPNALRDAFVGKWMLVGSFYSDQYTPDSTDLLYLKQDNTFCSTFSFFWDLDSSKNITLTGTWRPDSELFYPGVTEEYLIFTSDSVINTFTVSKFDSITMKWWQDGYITEIFRWVKVKEDPLDI
jgi:hypothetical protein